MKSCSDWQEELLDHALGIPASADLAAHVSCCAACAGAVQELHQRAAQIDTGVRALFRAEPSPFLASRVLVHAAERATCSLWPAWLKPALATLLLIALAWFGVHVVRGSIERRRNEAAQAAARSIASWHSPTEGLLRSSADSLLKSLPRLGETYFEWKPKVAASEQQKGEKDAS